MINIRKFPGKNLDIMIISFWYIFSGIIGCLCLGFYLPAFHMNYVEWRTRKQLGIKQK